MRVIGKALYGSQNYHLDGPQSDKDYKIFVVPEFIDLYHMRKGNKMSLPIGYDPDHNSALDFRNFDSLLREGNANTIELLFSSDYSLYDRKIKYYFEVARSAYERQYIAYKWDNFVSCVKGIVLNAFRRNEDNKKSLSRGLWWVNFVTQIMNHNFIIDFNTFKDDFVWNLPRKIRYNEENYTLGEKDFNLFFSNLEKSSEEKLKQVDNIKLFGSFYENLMMKTAQSIIRGYIQEELENK